MTEGVPDGVPKVGDTIAAKYVVEGVLGEGGMGVVLAARHVQLGQKVAIKFLRKDAARHPEAVSRFLREAKAAVALQSPNVVRVMDVGTLEDGLPYMVMEHLGGTDLGAVLERRGPLPVPEAVDDVLQAMEAIAEAHAAGLVHRDLKPANLFLAARPDGSGMVKVLDFGISKASEADGNSQRLTATATVMGSPVYMSPEQLRSAKNVDARTDVWALGVILYELTTGRTPFEDETVTGLCSKIAADPPVPLRQRRADLPAAFEAIVMRCLEKDMTRRPQSVGELAAALKPFASAEGKLSADRTARIGAQHAVASGDGAQAASHPALHSTTGYADTVATWQTAGAVKRRRTVTTVAAAVVAVTALGVGGVALLHANRATPAAGEPPPARSDTASSAIVLPPSPSPLPPASAATLAATPGTAPSATASAVPVPPSASNAPASTHPAGLAGHATAAPRPTTARPSAPKPNADDLLLDRK